MEKNLRFAVIMVKGNDRAEIAKHLRSLAEDFESDHKAVKNGAGDHYCNNAIDGNLEYVLIEGPRVDTRDWAEFPPFEGFHLWGRTGN